MISMVRVAERPQEPHLITHPALCAPLNHPLAAVASALFLSSLDARIWANSASHHSYSASQADAVVFKALSSAPDAAKYPNAARWYKHIASYEDDFPTLPGDASKPYTVYGPEVAEVTLNPAKAPAAEEEEDEDVDLFGSDDEEEDAEAVRIREERLAEYRAKKEAKPKVAAKSIVTLDVKPWGACSPHYTPQIAWRTCNWTLTSSPHR